MSASSKERFNSSRICFISSSPYWKHGGMSPSQFSLPHKLFSNALTLPRISRTYNRVFGAQVCLLGLPKIYQSGQGLFYISGIFITSRGSKLTRLLLSPFLIESSVKLSETMSRWLNSQEFCIFSRANTVIFCTGCLRIMDIESTTTALLALDVFEILNPSHPVHLRNFIKTKINLNFYFHTSLWCLKRFCEGL